MHCRDCCWDRRQGRVRGMQRGRPQEARAAGGTRSGLGQSCQLQWTKWESIVPHPLSMPAASIKGTPPTHTCASPQRWSAA